MVYVMAMGTHGTRTMIVIAHRLSTIKKCDMIFEVGEGMVIAKDKREVLGETVENEND